jgi:hypothetical protein
MLLFYISNKNGICRIDQNKLRCSCLMLQFVLYNRRELVRELVICPHQSYNVKTATVDELSLSSNNVKPIILMCDKLDGAIRLLSFCCPVKSAYVASTNAWKQTR